MGMAALSSGNARHSEVRIATSSTTSLISVKHTAAVTLSHFLSACGAVCFVLRVRNAFFWNQHFSLSLWNSTTGETAHSKQLSKLIAGTTTSHQFSSKGYVVVVVVVGASPYRVEVTRNGEN